MANVKISNLPAETDINNILGFAGYNAAGTCKISGADLINTLPSSTPPLTDVLTAGNTVQDQFINIQTTSDARNTRFDKNGIEQSNFASDLLISQIGAGRVFISTNNNDIVLQALGTGGVVFNTPEIKLQAGDVLDSTNSAGSAGEVLSSLGSGNGTEWVAAASPPSKTPQILTPGTTTWTIANGYNAILNNNTATTLSIPGLVDGDTGTLIVNTTASGTISWPALSVWAGGTPPTLTNNGTDIFSFLYVFPTYYWSYGQDFS